jgi:ribosomal protein S18 acetylase RimI-like enzyme
MTRCHPTLQDQQFLEDRLYEHNSERTGRRDGELFAFHVRDDRQEVVAGVFGWTWAGACEIRSLWVHPAWRGQGHGRALMEAAEQEARTRGCQVILLSSYSFQAPELYRRLGYELVWTLNDFPPGHRNCYLVKRLGEAGTGP